MIKQNYQKILMEDMEKSGLTQKEVESIYQELAVLVEMIGSATEQEKIWIGQDFEKLMRKLKRI